MTTPYPYADEAAALHRLEREAFGQALEPFRTDALHDSLLPLR